MQCLGRLYVRRFDYTYARSGTLFEGHFKTSIVQEDNYLLTSLHAQRLRLAITDLRSFHGYGSRLRYIELNPIRAGMVKHPGDYKWSSYRAHAFGIRSRLWSPHGLYLELGKHPKKTPIGLESVDQGKPEL